MLDLTLFMKRKRLGQYGVSEGEVVRTMPDTDRLEVLEAVKSDPRVVVAAGGSALNSARAAQWALGPGARPGACAHIGAVGSDEGGDIIKESCGLDRVRPILQRINGARTGQAAVLVAEESGERSIVPIRGAYRALSCDFVLGQDTEARRALEGAQVIYATSFLLSTPERRDAVWGMSEIALADSDKQFALNLSSSGFLRVDAHRKSVLSLLPRTDLVFGNIEEAEALVGARSGDESDDTVVKRLASRLARGGRAIVTRGADATLVADYNGVREHSVRIPVHVDALGSVLDTNGAGDAFVGGFLAAASQGLDEAASVAVGHWAAGVTVRSTGAANWVGIQSPNVSSLS